MSLSLSQIADVVSTKDAATERLLRSFAQELDRRHAQQKRAFHAALLLLRQPVRDVAPTIDEFDRGALTVVVRGFTTDRHRLMERFSVERERIKEEAWDAGLPSSDDDEAYCRLVDPLSDDEGRLEIMLPVIVSRERPRGFTVKRLPPARCAAVTMRSTHTSEFSAVLDALFDWFDQRGHRAVDTPLIAMRCADSRAPAKIVWAYEGLPTKR